MAGLLNITVDMRDLLAAIDRAPAAIQVHVTEAASLTAHAIANDAKTRVHRRAGPNGGQTAAGILVRSDGQGGFWVDSTEPGGPGHDPANVPIWLEFGTVHQPPYKYFFISADLERGANERRMIQAIEDGLADVGLGE